MKVTRTYVKKSEGKIAPVYVDLTPHRYENDLGQVRWQPRIGTERAWQWYYFEVGGVYYSENPEGGAKRKDAPFLMKKEKKARKHAEKALRKRRKENWVSRSG